LGGRVERGLVGLLLEVDLVLESALLLFQSLSEATNGIFRNVRVAVLVEHTDAVVVDGLQQPIYI
jgi:hypothetical protein